MASSNVDTVKAAWTEMKAGWAMVDALWGGTKAMRKALRLYLPAHPAESDAAYAGRLERSFLFNVFKAAINNLCGRVFAKPLVLADDIPTPLVELMGDVDRQGNSLQVFAKDVMTSGLKKGVAYILVDMPVAVKDETLKAERDRGALPFFVQIAAEQIRYWRAEVVAGRLELAHVRIWETITEPDGQFGEVEIEQIRVLEPGTYALYRQRKTDKNKVEWVQHEQGKMSPRRIPLVPYYTHRTGVLTADLPMADLADKNVEHWQSSSDQRNILSFARFPMLGVSGAKATEIKEMEIGPNKALHTSNPQGKWYYVEHTGAAIASGVADLDALEKQMASLALDPMMHKKPGMITATERAIDSSQANNQLEMWAIALGAALTVAKNFAGEFMGLGETSAGDIKLNKDFADSVSDETDMAALLTAREMGDLSRETLWSEMKRRGLLSETIDLEDEAERIEAEGPRPGTEEDDLGTDR